MRTSESIAELAKALSQFQQEVKQPVKDGTNPHFKSQYVTLDGTVKTIQEYAPKHGLSFSQMPVSNESGVGVVTIIFHNSGEFIEFDPFYLPLDKRTAQGAGSGLTYSRRYSLSAAFGIVSDVDDDGNEATAQEAPKPASSKQIGLLKVKVGEFAKARQKSSQDVYQALNVKEEELDRIPSRAASDMIKKLDSWIEKAKAEITQ